MSVDPNNIIVQLCARGIEEEMSGNIVSAYTLYTEAWEKKSTDYEAAIVAHYMARIQSSNEDMLHWNLQALRHADKVEDEDVSAFYPSLHLNIGKCYEDLNNIPEAIQHYRLGAEKTDLLPNDPLGNLTRDALKRGLERIKNPSPSAGEG